MDGHDGDETITVGQLPSARLGDRLHWVSQDTPFSTIETLLLLNRVSQLPVFSNKERRASGFKGVVSWESIARAKLRNPEASPRVAVVPATVVRADDDLIRLSPVVRANDFVFVERQGRIDGLVTLYDLVELFEERTVPFLLVGEIDRRLRRTIEAHQLVLDSDRAVTASHGRRAVQLSFGDYVEVLTQPANWERLAWPLDQRLVIKAIDRVRALRNELLHFRVAPIGSPCSADHVSELRNVLDLLRDFTQSEKVAE